MNLIRGFHHTPDLGGEGSQIKLVQGEKNLLGLSPLARKKKIERRKKTFGEKKQSTVFDSVCQRKG